MGSNDWVIGVSFSFASSFLSCLGLIFQKYAHNQNQALPDDKKYPVVIGIVCSPCWWASFIMMGLFPFPFDFFAYSFAAQSIVAPIAGVTLVLNQILAPLILKEKLYRIDIYASIVVFIGCTLTTITGDHESVTLTLDDLLSFFKRTEFIVGLVIILTIMIAMLFSLTRTDPTKNTKTEKKEPTTPGNDVTDQEQAQDESELVTTDKTTSLDVTDADIVVAIDDNKSEGSTKTLSWKEKASKLNFALRPFYYGFIAGGFGGLQNIFFKMIGTLMKTSVFDGGPSAWGTWYPYVFGILTIILAVLQLSFLNKGMSRYNAVLVLPLYNACYIFLSVTLGALYYGEFADFVTRQWILFPVGVFITLCGIIMFVFKPREHDEQGKEQTALRQVVHNEAPTQTGDMNRQESLLDLNCETDKDSSTNDNTTTISAQQSMTML
mmetsp:Transcript_29014/g.46792  ORF Transcript_29014/g.46792 Transcript_29014/m.46792 type:complete len:436 (-) Transcript_29014:174-1481(-)|eukprot:CAMPEP_0203761532 /NCGR_PEP_ID=MMETSP0098-20131031/14599_1 /ASSEMBLY_ACC=CAM_ASM_000208 /TAXON_ID=96639 /ORGANISM=" , Strain NY0313808BC1" /LENGTH=435 /DNA_ID=CAMNT_0050655563 /DNA_START=344 /DNA_END=1651 /DNA_ORIENTATION=+